MNRGINKGLLYAFGAYLAWGISPIFWKLLQSIPGTQTTAHRVIWAFLIAAVIVTLQKDWSAIGRILRDPKTVLTFMATGALILVNWLIYIYAVNRNEILATSLGYFMYPLVNVLLGVIFLGERLRTGQWAVVGVAALGVFYTTLSYGSVPWIALALPVTFGFYGLLRKVARLNAMQGLTVEMAFMTPFVLLYLLYTASAQASISWIDGTTLALLAFGGVVTAVPLVLFSAGARLVPLSVVGLLQYIAPTIQFFIGILVFHEPFDSTQFIGFCMVWLALILFAVEGLLARRRTTLVSHHPYP